MINGEGGDWILTGTLFCQPSQAGTASGRIITVVKSAFHSLSFTKAVGIHHSQGLIFSAWDLKALGFHSVPWYKE